MEWIFESKPEIILFDMKYVNYVNLRGLRVILRTIIEMNQRRGQVYLTNLQPEIKKMFEVMNGALPEWVFENRKLWENYLDAITGDYQRRKICQSPSNPTFHTQLKKEGPKTEGSRLHS